MQDVLAVLYRTMNDFFKYSEFKYSFGAPQLQSLFTFIA